MGQSAKANQDAPVPELIQEPPTVPDLLLGMARRVPWWAVLLFLLIFWVGIDMLNDKNDRDILDWLADRPEVNTNELYDVVYEVKTEVLLVSETVRVRGLDDVSVTVPIQQVASQADGVINCPEDAAEGCLSQRGVVVTYQDFENANRESPDGVVETRGLRTGVVGPLVRVTLADGVQTVVAPNDIVSEEEGVLACNPIAVPDCESTSGQIITFNRPYSLRQSIRVRADARIRHLDDGYEITIRPNRILSRREGTLECLPDAVDCVATPVTFVVYPERIIGTELRGENDDEIQVRTVEQQSVQISRDRIINMEIGMVTCDRSEDPRCRDYEGTIVSVSGETFSGRLSTESGSQYDLILEGDAEATEFERRDIKEELRDPDGCTATDAVACEVTITMNDSTVAGRIIADNDGGITVETVPEKIITLRKGDIYSTTARTYKTCALNNPRGCNAGIWLTIIVTLSAFSLALLIGLLMGLFRVSSNPILYHLSTFYVELVRGVPLLVILLYFAFVVSPQMRDADGIIGDITHPIYDTLTKIEVQVLGNESFLAEAVIGLAVGYGAFLAEVFRAGIQSVSRGQTEAARSLGMSYFQSMRHVILPQAIRTVLPPLGNDFIAMLKDSSLIAILALPELLQQGRLYSTRTFQAIPAYNAVAIFYIVMTLSLSLMVRAVERRSRLP